MSVHYDTDLNNPYIFLVVFSGFFLEGRVFRWVGKAHTKGIVHTQFLWCGSNRIVVVAFRSWLGDLGTQFGL
jgi:hypothetical protein